jgi:hypothetical protein
MEKEKIVGRYVETDEYRKEVEKHGFKYSPISRSLFLAYPYLPTKFSNYAVRVNLYHVGVSAVSKIDSIEYYVKGEGYMRIETPENDFKEYAENILKGGLMKALPKTFLA